MSLLPYFPFILFLFFVLLLSTFPPVYPESLTTYITFIRTISLFLFLVGLLFIGLSSLLFISCTALYQAYDFHYFILPFLLHLYSIPLASSIPIDRQIYFQCHILPHPF
jgi:hypothetical protein